MAKKKPKKTRKPTKKNYSYGESLQFDTEAQMYKAITGHESTHIK